MELEEVGHRYSATGRDELKSLLDEGADKSQLETNNDTNKRAIERNLESYIYSSALNLYEASTSVTVDPLRLVLLGWSGAGKSATGNTILGKDAFPVSDTGGEVTSAERLQSGSWNTCKLEVLDTPGSWKMPKDFSPSNQELYVLVVNLTNPRFSRKQLEKIRQFKDKEGRPLLKNKLCVLVFTYAREALRDTNLVEYVHDIQGEPLEQLISHDLNGIRVMAVNNHPYTEYERQEQREKLIGFLLGASSRADRENPVKCAIATKRKIFLGSCIIIGILVVILVAVFA